MMNCAFEVGEQASTGPKVARHDMLVPSEPGKVDAILRDLVTCFNEKDLSRALLQAVGLVIIQELAEATEVNNRLAQWKERWRETVRLEAQPMRKQG